MRLNPINNSQYDGAQLAITNQPQEDLATQSFSEGMHASQG